MPYASNGGVDLYYETDGEGETVAFVGDLGLGAWQWGWQHAAVAGPYEALVMDSRGCGRSDDPPADCTIETLAADVAAVLRDHGARSVHLVGAGLGGMVALQVALGSSRPASLTLIGTAAAGDGLNPAPFAADTAAPEDVRDSLQATFSRSFLQNQPDLVRKMVEWRSAEDADGVARDRLAAALDTVDLSDRLVEVTTPALVVHGREDRCCPFVRGEELARDLPRGDLFAVDDAGHFAHVEASKAVNDRLLAFLGEQ